MKVVSLLGSPRKKGNSAVILNRFCAAAEESGTEVQRFYLNDLDYRDCQGCLICKTKLDHCVLDDDLAPVLEAVRQADVLVMASPVYFWDVSGLLKSFMDRTYSYFVPDFLTNPQKSRLAPGKKMVLILSQTNPDAESYPDIFMRWDHFFKGFGFTGNHVIRGLGMRHAGEVDQHPEVLRLAEEIAGKVCRA